MNNLKLLRSYNKIASNYYKSSFLFQEIAMRLLEKLQTIPFTPHTVLQLGCRTGLINDAIQFQFPEAYSIHSEFSDKMLQESVKKTKKPYVLVSHSLDKLPFLENSFDLIICNLGLHWYQDLNTVLKEIKKILKPGGILLFSLLAKDTLSELKDVLTLIQKTGIINDFFDLHHIGDILLAEKFINPVVEVEKIFVFYSQLKELFLDLKNMGSYKMSQKNIFLTKTDWLYLLKSYELLRTAQGLPSTWEVIYGHAIKPFLSSSKNKKNNQKHIPIKIY
ncbi:MAG: uncharacterized protein JWM09_668 [Francisellaceae bacterium]|nr:uncharacterized protein [Francisellaceae bacterium]